LSDQARLAGHNNMVSIAPNMHNWTWAKNAGCCRLLVASFDAVWFAG